MGILLPAYRAAVIDAITEEIGSNTGYYYAFAANAAPSTGSSTTPVASDYSSSFSLDWELMFGKRLDITDLLPVINNVTWTSGTTYAQYDCTSANLSTAQFYVLTQPALYGQYNVYKCVYNNSNAASVNIPNLVQPSTFTTADGYMWRYVTTITYSDYIRFSVNNFVPIYPNSSIVASANQYAGVDVAPVINPGSGYSATTNGTVVAVINSSLIQIQTGASPYNDTYAMSGIYLQNSLASTSQLNYVSHYVANTLGNWVFLAQSANATNITPSVTKYLITPRVIFTSDGSSDPQGYCTVDSSANSISNIVMINPGSGVSWANVQIVANSNYGSGASAYAIVPPPGGHGANVASELFVKGLSFSFSFVNTEDNTVPTNVSYNTIGILKNPYALTASGGKGVQYTNVTFNQLLTCTISPAKTFPVGEQVTGTTSGAVGTVALSNTSTLWLTGDKYFVSGEYVTDSTNTVMITINTPGSVYARDQHPLYVQNISTVTRSNTQTETFQVSILL